jgi:hypothetical protein
VKDICERVIEQSIGIVFLDDSSEKIQEEITERKVSASCVSCDSMQVEVDMPPMLNTAVDYHTLLGGLKRDVSSV